MAIGPLSGKVAVITGGNSGIGAATAHALAAHGMAVVLSARRHDRLATVADSIRAKGGRVHTFACDVAAPNASLHLLDEAERSFGGVDVVFANAGYGMERAHHVTTDADFRRMFEVNFFASVDLFSQTARRWIARKQRGHLLMTSSCVAKFTLPYFGAYAATKASQAMMCRAMRFELEPYGIEVSSVHPVSTITDFFTESAARSGIPMHGKKIPSHTPKIFVQHPEQVARAIVRCLQKPSSEVWTSRTVRLAAGVITAFPWIFDRACRREAARSRRHLGEKAAHEF